MFEVAITLRRKELQRDALDESATVDAHLLRRHADPGVALTGQVAMKETPVRGRVDSCRHVVPLHDRRTAERVSLERAADDEPGTEASFGARDHVPTTVRTALAQQLV